MNGLIDGLAEAAATAAFWMFLVFVAPALLMLLWRSMKRAWRSAARRAEARHRAAVRARRREAAADVYGYEEMRRAFDARDRKGSAA